MTIQRAAIETILLARDWPALIALAQRKRRLLSAILPFTYQPEGLLRWRAVEALGLAARAVAARDPEFVRGLLRRLQWSLSDESGGIGWSAPEAMGEIVAARSDLFADFGPIVAALFETLEEDYFRPGILWGVGRIAEQAPVIVGNAYEPALACLDDARPAVRGLASWCLGRLGRPEAGERLRGLWQDEAALAIYRDGELVTVTVSDQAREAIARLARQG
ncbi:MAG: hypothetical protein M1401_00160 [Chloroflexi bacterium]|nr:hypothetical protein [Chloroflexota bacterium]MCL5107294.1 hypothetical protein [Chloroflexota bacterium]